MSKNHIEQIAQMLGVELDERFKIHNIKFNRTYPEVYYFDKQLGLTRLAKDIGNGEYMPLTCGWELTKLIMGGAKVVKLPWKPKLGETYYTFIGGNIKDKNWVIGENKWCDGVFDFIWLKLGLIFKTREEAKDALPRVYKELMGEDYAE